MKKRSPFLTLMAGLSVASGFSLSSCSDTTYGQDTEPPGPILITRLTLLDGDSRDNPVFTDTSAPLDCTDPSLMNTPPCYNDPFMDKFSLKMSPPTPFSDEQIRVVFNKLPLLWNGNDLEMVQQPAGQPPMGFMLASDSIISLACTDSGCGVPKLLGSAQLSGTSLSPDPTSIPYGPALQLSADTGSDPVASLEPESNYQVNVDPGVAGRDGNKVTLDDKAKGLLKFKTELFQILAVDTGTAHSYVYSDPTLGTAAKPYQVTDPSNLNTADDGVVAIQMNAPVDDAWFATATFSATVGTKSVDVKATLLQPGIDPKSMAVICAKGDQRSIFIYPATGSWGQVDKGKLTITVKSADIHNLSQTAGHPPKTGTHTLKTDVVISTTLSKDVHDPQKYKGLVARTDRSCPAQPPNPPTPLSTPDMAMGNADMSGGADGGTDAMPNG